MIPATTGINMTAGNLGEMPLWALCIPIYGREVLLNWQQWVGLPSFRKPAGGRQKKASYRFNEKARYSLIVSIRTKEIHSEINLYAEVENKIKNELQTEVEITA